jgi:CO/xanthine dehydrogenase Mo-binding subunit
MAQIASEETGIEISNITVRHYADTDSAKAYLGSIASRSTYIAGLAVQDAGRNLLSAIKTILPLSYDPGQHTDVSIANNSISFGSHNILLSDLFEESLVSTGFAESELNPPSYGVHFVEVEVDALTGHVDILSYVAAQDVGFAINPKMVEGQLEGAISQGIEFALCSEIKLDRGIPLNPNLADYSVISAWEMPRTLVCEIIESNEESGPYGAKGIGTPAMPPIAPAIINAIRDATGIRFSKAPVESEHIAMALLKNRGDSA